jgi:hypothetical protein
MKIEHVSPSRLKIVPKCDFKYFLQYEWLWADELFTYTFAGEFGTVVHNTLEAYVKSKCQLDYKERYRRLVSKEKPYSKDMNAAPSKARAAFFIDKACQECPFFDSNKCQIMKQDVDSFEGCPKKLYEDGLLMVGKAIDRYGEYFITGIKSKDNPNGRVIGVELPANISWGNDDDGNNIIMNGFIDLVVEYDKETLLIVDYKTGFSVPTHDEFIKDLQPRMYSYAAKILFPEYKYYWTQFDYFRGIPIEHAFTAEDDEKTRNEVVSLYNYVKNKKKITRRGYDRYCQYLCNRPFCDQKWTELKMGINGKNPEIS